MVLRLLEVVLDAKKPAEAALQPVGMIREIWEREKGFEPSTSTLARLHSTTELLPQKSNRDGVTRPCSPRCQEGPGRVISPSFNRVAMVAVGALVSSLRYPWSRARLDLRAGP